jgi:hypothetical protein
VLPVTMAFTPKVTVRGTMVTGKSSTSRNPARTFRLTWSGFDEERKVGVVDCGATVPLSAPSWCHQ